MKQLYNLAGGIPKIGQATVNVAVQNTNVEVVAAVSGKIIIPMWVLIYPTGDDGFLSPVYLLQKGGKLYIRQLEINPQLDGKLFHRFELSALGGDMGTGAVTVKVTVAGSYTFKVVLGYYLVDASA